MIRGCRDMSVYIRDRIAELPKGQNGLYKTRRLSDIDTIVIHHSATQPTRDNASAFARFHIQTRGWPGIGYHYVVNPDGIVDKCQPVSAISYHAGGVNSRAVGICVVGNFDYTMPSSRQWNTAIDLCKQIIQAIPNIKTIIGHNEVPGTSKSCPGKRFKLDAFRAALESNETEEGRPASQDM